MMNDEAHDMYDDLCLNISLQIYRKVQQEKEREEKN